MKIKAASISMQGIANPREIIYFVFAPRVTASEVREGKNRGEVPVTRSRHCGDVGINSSVNVMAMTTDGRHLITGSDADCSVWDAVTKKNITVLRGHTKWVCGLAAHPSEPYAVTASYDRSVRVWDLRNGRNVLTLFGYESELYTASIALDGTRLVMTDVAGVVHVVDFDAKINVHHSENQNNGAGMKSEFLGLRTVKYHVPDIEKGKKWYADILGIQPYFDEPFYVGFNVGGYELGLDPDMAGVKPGNNSMAYWGVKDIEKSLERLLKLGAVKETDILDVGGGIKVASVVDPFGNSIGIIENPTFVVE